MSAASHRSQTPQTQRQPASSSTVDGSASSSTNAGSGKASAAPFVSNPHGHPSFNPIKIGTKGSGDSKTPKQPKAPDKPLMPYMRYSRKVSRLVWDSVKASNPDLKLWEIGKIIGQMWRELSDDEKQEYLDEYDAEKLQYTEAMKAYHNSPAYQSWLSAKGKGDQEAESEEPEKTRRSKTTAGGSAAVAEARSVTIQPCEEDDDGDDTYSVKHVAAARFHRNHCLINEIFSDAVVPDVRTVINEGRMAVLKRQVVSLTMHQKKLEGELEIIEQKHTSKKSQFSENSERFYEDLAKLCNEKPHVTEDQFSAMVTKAKEELREKQRVASQQQKQQLSQLYQQKVAEIQQAAAVKKAESGGDLVTNGNQNGSATEEEKMEAESSEQPTAGSADPVSDAKEPAEDGVYASANVEKHAKTASKQSNGNSLLDDSNAAEIRVKGAEADSKDCNTQKDTTNMLEPTNIDSLELPLASDYAPGDTAPSKDPSTVELSSNGSEAKPGSKRKHEDDDEAETATKHPKLSAPSSEISENVNSSETVAEK